MQEETIQTTSNEEVPFVTTTEGQIIYNPNSKIRAIVRLAYEIVKSEEEFDKATQYCISDDENRINMTLEQYALKRFNKLLRRFPEIKEEYLANKAKDAELIKASRAENVKRSKERLANNRKARRKAKKSK